MRAPTTVRIEVVIAFSDLLAMNTMSREGGYHEFACMRDFEVVDMK